MIGQGYIAGGIAVASLAAGIWIGVEIERGKVAKLVEAGQADALRQVADVNKSNVEL